MLYIIANSDDYEFFSKIQKEYSEDIILLSSKNFDGSSELIEVFIELTPSILLTLTAIIHEIVSYMKNKNKCLSETKDTQPSEITIEKKNNDQFKIIVKSSDIQDVETTVIKIMDKIKNDSTQN